MTKQKMIETIQKREEEEWVLLRNYIEFFGANSDEANRQRGRWVSLNRLCDELNIKC